jgi:pseudouridine kinase
MRTGSDVPGSVTRLPGGVAMNIAMTLINFGLTPAVLSAVGRDPEGDELVHVAANLGIITEHLYRPDDLPTDSYIAIESADGLIAAIADALSLEKAGTKILAPLTDGTLGSNNAPWSGLVALDGNLTSDLLNDIARAPLFTNCDLRVAPASPGKVKRLSAFFDHPSATLYVNLEEAGLLCKTTFDAAIDGAAALSKQGIHRVLVTDGGNLAAECLGGDICIAQPPAVLVTRVTGAGDTFMAAHIASEVQGMTRKAALLRAVNAAATYVSGETPS